MKEVTIYTDGACLGNPGPGGYGAVLQYGAHKKELSAGFKLTTNNRMEMLACIVALKALKEPCKVTLHSDSKYVVDSITKGWAKRWQSKGWMRNAREKAINPDLWENLLTAISLHQVTFKWVKGHAGNPGNERCDQLATTAARESATETDHGYSAS